MELKLTIPVPVGKALEAVRQRVAAAMPFVAPATRAAGQVAMSRRIGRALQFIDFEPLMEEDTRAAYLDAKDAFVHRNSEVAGEGEMIPFDLKLLQAAEAILAQEGL